MTRDFTLTTFRNLLTTLSAAGYSFATVTEHKNVPGLKTVVLRHDVDSSPLNSVSTAMAEHASGIRGTYYFRCGRHGFDREIIRQIADLGHETGYHYEDLSFAWRSAKKGSREDEIAATAYERFRSNLQKIRDISVTHTVCMHGSPMSSTDSRLMWKYVDYKELGIVAEPYMDISFEEMLYLTDTGRRWDGSSFSVRDKAGFGSNRSGDGYKKWIVVPLPGSLMNMTPQSEAMQAHYRFRTTAEIERAALAGKLPNRIMLTVHPQRWDDKIIPWVRELVFQKTKNTVKYCIVKFNDSKAN